MPQRPLFSPRAASMAKATAQACCGGVLLAGLPGLWANACAQAAAPIIVPSPAPPAGPAPSELAAWQAELAPRIVELAQRSAAQAQASLSGAPTAAGHTAAGHPAAGNSAAGHAAEAKDAPAAPLRLSVELGQLDPRLRLAPCAKIEPYLPAGLPAWGRTRMGLKCSAGPKAWNVSLPITVHVWRQGQVLREALPAGATLQASHLMAAEVDLAAAPGAAILESSAAIGRVLARPLPAGAALRPADFKARQWFAAGETVRVVAGGPGWRIATEGQAMSAGLEGQAVRVRTENGKWLQGRAVADRLVEVGL